MLLMEKGKDRRYLPDPFKSLFIANSLEQEEVVKREFSTERIYLNSVGGSWYLGAYLGPWEELEARLKPKVEKWAHGVKVSSKIAKRHPSCLMSDW